MHPVDSTSTQSQESYRKFALVTPFLDVVLGGGLSIVVLATVMLLDIRPLKGHDAGALTVLTIALNWPHFVSSYFLLYRTRQSVMQHRWASMYWPAILALCGVVSVAIAPTQQIPWNLLIVFSGLYLARHYTGLKILHIFSNNFDHLENLRAWRSTLRQPQRSLT